MRRSLSVGLAIFALFLITLNCPARAQEAAENPNAGTIQGTVRNEGGDPVSGARVFYNSTATDTKGMTRSDKDGNYVSEPLPPGTYALHADGRDLFSAEVTVTVSAGVATPIDFKLDWINPGPDRLESHYDTEAVHQLPINGGNYLQPAETEPGVQPVDGAVYAPGKSGTQSLGITSLSGRTTHFSFDEIEAMDETKGGASMNLPADSIREVTVSRVTPPLFQSLNAAGAVRATTRSGGENWHGDVYGNLRDQFLGLAGFPDKNSDYSRQQYGFGVGGALIQKKAFVFVGGERSKQDGKLPTALAYPFDGLSLRDAYFRENMITGRVDYSFNENMKLFARVGYDNANLVGPENSLSGYRNHINVPSAAIGLDWNRERFVHSMRFGFQKMVNAIDQNSRDSLALASAPFHVQLGSYSFGPTTAGLRQTIQQDIFARWDASTVYRDLHTIRFGAAYRRIAQGDYYALGGFGPSVTSSNGIATIGAIDGDPSLTGGSKNPLNYPVGTFTIYNGLGNFSENSAFNRSTGGHFDHRLEAYAGDTFSVRPNINISFGANYIFDTGRTDSDLARIKCSAINTTIVTSAPCSGNELILDQFALGSPDGIFGAQTLGQVIARPYTNFAPQAGLAWDPGHNGRTVVRASGGLFYDNYLIQNLYQDRISRLAKGQYNRSLTLCPTGSVLFPDGSVVNSVDGLDIATEICGQPLGTVSTAIQDLQSEFLSTQSGLSASSANVYSLAGSVANFGGMIAPKFKTPRVVHMNLGLERQMGVRSMFSIDYVRELGTQFPLGVDTNHVGDYKYLNNGDNIDITQNTYAAELAAINSTLASNSLSASCPTASYTGSSSQTAVQCYIDSVPGASIVDFARNGLDSSNSYCGPFPCSVLYGSTSKPTQASFGGINPAVGSNLMYFPSGRSRYEAVHFKYHTSSAANPMRRVQKIDIGLAYTLSRYRSNMAEPNGSGGDYSNFAVAEDFRRPHLGHFGSAGFDRTHQFVLTPTVELPHGPVLSMITMLASPLPLTARIPQTNGGGQPGEIFSSDVSGDGTAGDLLTGSFIGTTGRYSSTKVTEAIAYYNKNVAGNLTPAGAELVSAGLLSSAQMKALGAYMPLISSCYPATASCGLPGRWANPTWLKTIDLRLNWPIAVGEHAKVEPNLSVFNVFNFANYGGAGSQLSGVLDGSPGTSMNNSTSPGTCGNSTSYCTSRLDRVLPGSGTYANGAPRQLQFGVRITF